MDTQAQQSALGDNGWRLGVMVLSMFAVPAIACINSGLVRKKSELSMIMLAAAACILTVVEWYAIGYSLAFSPSSILIGDFRNAGLRSILGDDDTNDMKPVDVIFFVSQTALASMSAALVTGATAERGSPWPCLIFIMLWNLLVYVPVAYWIWNPSGWLYKLGAVDCAGGTIAHICAGFASMVYSWFLGLRHGYRTSKVGIPHNVQLITFGTFFFLVGVTGISSSTLPSDISAVKAALHICLATCMGGITWTSIDALRFRQFSLVSLSSGSIAGLIAVSSGAGSVPAWACLLYGLVAGATCNWATGIKFWTGIDDALDIFAFHGIGGVVGSLLTGFFARKPILLSGVSTHRFPDGVGWMDGHWVQPGIQLAAAVCAAAWSSVISFLLLWAFYLLQQHLSALKWQRLAEITCLRVSEGQERLGIDHSYVLDVPYDEEGTNTVSPADDMQSESQTDLLPPTKVNDGPDAAVDIEMSPMSSRMGRTGTLR